jgi:CheY-like chemotaxis protein
MHFPMFLRPAVSDASQLELAVLNLVLNARDAMPQGGLITISARQESLAAGNVVDLPAGEYVCLAVTDAGEGMDAETLARAAEPFFTTKGAGRGTGLGLSMVHGIAEQSGGRLRLQSEKGNGTTAEIWLPAAPEARVPAAVAPPRESIAPAAPMVILVVDDDRLVLLNTSAMLEELGHRPIEATSAAQALQILRGGTPVDLLITDQIMPGMKGIELVAAVREEWPELRTILATGYAELPAEAQLDVPRLSKPFQQAELARVIARAVEGQRGTVLKLAERRSR